MDNIPLVQTPYSGNSGFNFLDYKVIIFAIVVIILIVVGWNMWKDKGNKPKSEQDVVVARDKMMVPSDIRDAIIRDYIEYMNRSRKPETPAPQPETPPVNAPNEANA